ncbi:MAG: HD domain-containing protein [Candidatus Paceibacterota bacterium]
MKKTASDIFAQFRAKFHNLYNFVKTVHEGIIASGKSTHGHGLDHDLTVAQYGAKIAPNKRVGELAWVAGLLHSLDRHFSADETRRYVEEGLSMVAQHFTAVEIQEIRTAVEEHSKMNQDTDGIVTMVIKDADRLANLGAINLIRGGQHRPCIPAYIPETLGQLHPLSTFSRPMSCFDATFYNLEWREMLRLPMAKELGEKYFQFIKDWQALVVSQATEVGLYPWPK